MYINNVLYLLPIRRNECSPKQEAYSFILQTVLLSLLKDLIPDLVSGNADCSFNLTYYNRIKDTFEIMSRWDISRIPIYSRDFEHSCHAVKTELYHLLAYPAAQVQV